MSNANFSIHGCTKIEIERFQFDPASKEFPGKTRFGNVRISVTDTNGEVTVIDLFNTGDVLPVAVSITMLGDEPAQDGSMTAGEAP